MGGGREVKGKNKKSPSKRLGSVNQKLRAEVRLAAKPAIAGEADQTQSRQQRIGAGLRNEHEGICRASDHTHSTTADNRAADAATGAEDEVVLRGVVRHQLVNAETNRRGSSPTEPTATARRCESLNDGIASGNPRVSDCWHDQAGDVCGPRNAPIHTT